MDCDWLTDDEELDGPSFNPDLKEVTRSHFVDKNQRDRCHNETCPVTFVFPRMRRRHHCRRCGEVFCRDCLRYTRKLNVMAQPDSKGIPNRVCFSCYTERDIILEGARRSSTKDFLRMRTDYHEERRKLVVDVTIEIKKADRIPTFWKEQFQVNIPKQCQRLLDGFEEEIGSSDTMKTIEELQSLVTIPHWQKSTYWELEKSITFCRVCRANIARIKKKRNCRVCGLALCKKCAFKELLLYYEDAAREPVPRLSIIRHRGCPEKEPRHSLLLHVCEDCRKFITDKQILDPDWFIKKPKPPDVTSQLQALDDIFRDLITQIERGITKLQENLTSIRNVEDKENGRMSIFGLVQSLHEIDLKRDLIRKKDDIQSDIQQQLGRYFSLYTKLRTLRQDNSTTTGPCLTKLLNNYIKCRNEFYIKTSSTITSLTKAAGEDLESNHI